MHEADLYTLENIPAPRLFLQEVKNCVITRSMCVMTAAGAHRYCLYDNLPIGKKIQMNLAGTASLMRNKLYRLEGDDTHFFVFNPWSSGYYHWLTEVAIKFFLFEDELRRGVILLPANTPRFVSEFLGLFGFDNAKALNGNTFCRRLKLVSNPYTNHYNKEHLGLFRERVLSRVGGPNGAGKRRIYVSRRNARARKVVNEAEVVDLLKNYDFEFLDLEGAGFVDQVRAFSGCEMLVSIHGAALTNMIFTPMKSSVVELYPKVSSGKIEPVACYPRLANVLGRQHTFMFCATEHKGGAAELDSTNIIVDVNELAMLMEKFSAPTARRES